MDIRRIRLLFAKIEDIVDREISLMDSTGYIIESTNFQKVGEYDTSLDYAGIKDTIVSLEDRLYYLINTNYGKNFTLSITGDTSENAKLLQIIGLFLWENLSKLKKEDFIKGIILKEFEDNEIKEFCSKFNMDYDSKFKVIVIKLSEDIIDDSWSIITSMYPDEVLIRLNNTALAFIKAISGLENHDEFELNIYNTIFSELLYEPIIGVGIIVENLSYLSESYERANKLIKIGKKLILSKKIYYCNDLLLPMLIDNMDISKVRDLVQYTNCNVENILLDNELLMTAAKFLENNLNVSDTARKLYVHRNTLIYRLNKIHNVTGLDLRSFKDAVNFNILISCMRHLQSQST